MLDFLAGIAFGFAIGLLPGFHINNALPALVALVPFAGTTFIVSASVSFVFSSLVPATVLRLPNEETALIASESLHADALHACVLASVLACFFSLVVLAFYSAFLPQLYPAAGSVMPLLLLVIVGMLALQGLGNALVVGVSSMLGMITFNGDYLLPLLSGFFGTGALRVSERGTGALRVSERGTGALRVSERGTSALLRARDGTTPRPATARSIALSAAAASLVSSVFSLVPAVSSAVTSTAGRVLARLRGDEFVAFSAATNVSYMLFSFYALLLAGQARSGSAAFMQSFLLDDTVLHVAGVALASAGISAVACLYVSRQKLAAGRPVRLVGLVFLVFSNLLFAGAYGLLVFLTAASISVLARRLGVPLVATTSSLAFPTALALLRLI